MKPINKPINARLSRGFSRNTFAASLLILYVLFGPHAHSQAVLIKDINHSPDIIYPEYSEFVQASQMGKNWSPGLYLIQVRVGGAMITRKIIKK